ncbi:hypothetical protein EYC80_009774 [Monilinia laxa]|uniref:Uncharacterized protein n=1 Tax=Monilinia laxa TaxID=61186 RepID=A0A5N6JQM7_MONLA|nr:hypothetical protein EYC80_009774 [Monilinia laxa]
MPPIPSQTAWTPDVIVTVVYKVVMVFVSLIYLEKIPTTAQNKRPHVPPTLSSSTSLITFYIVHQLAELLAVRTSISQGDSEETRKPMPNKAVDLNDITQFMQALGTVISTTLSMDGDSTSISPSINFDLQQGQT